MSVPTSLGTEKGHELSKIILRPFSTSSVLAKSCAQIYNQCRGLMTGTYFNVARVPTVRDSEIMIIWLSFRGSDIQDKDKIF